MWVVDDEYRFMFMVDMLSHHRDDWVRCMNGEANDEHWLPVDVA